jgi:hypothetical protein
VTARAVPPLLCVAGLAAARLAKGAPRSRPRVRQSWHGMILRWRRVRRAFARSGTERSRAYAGTVVWQPQRHLHFVERTTQGGNRARAGGSPSFRTLRELRTTVVDRDPRAPGNVTRSYEPGAPGTRGRPGLDGRGGGGVARRMVGIASDIVFARTVRLSRVASFGCGQTDNPKSLSHVERRALRWSAAREFPALERRRPVGEQSTAFVAARRRALVPSLVWRSAEATPASRIHVASSAQMTWRAAPASPSADVDLFRAARATSSAPVVISASDDAKVMTASTLAPNASSPIQTKDLDPRVIDRLADDVIRRVERRARIERERRGV